MVGFRRPLDRRFVRFYKLSQDSAVEISSLDPRGPASKAGLMTGDVIVSLNGRPVASVDDLFRGLSEWAAPGVLKLGILRGKNLVECDCVPVEAA
jgi:S1-C subfamily serine protease